MSLIVSENDTEYDAFSYNADKGRPAQVLRREADIRAVREQYDAATDVFITRWIGRLLLVLLGLALGGGLRL